jgi:hypothetical protein
MRDVKDGGKGQRGVSAYELVKEIEEGERVYRASAAELVVWT